MEGLTFSQDLLKQGDWWPEGCLPHGTNTSRSPAFPPLHRGDSRLHVAVHLPSIQASMCPMGLHQANEGSSDLTKVMGTSYIDEILIMSESAAQHLEVLANSHSTMLGVCHQQ